MAHDVAMVTAVVIAATFQLTQAAIVDVVEGAFGLLRDVAFENAVVSGSWDEFDVFDVCACVSLVVLAALEVKINNL